MPPPLYHQSASFDGLPKQFIHSLSTLFGILDDKGTGFVRISDIETRWKDDGTKGLPKGVLESLRKVAPPNGLLSFERFCAGLKMCLLRNQMENQNKIEIGRPLNPADIQNIRPPSAPILDTDVKPKWNSTNMAAVRPTQQRTLSMPQLQIEQKENFNSEADSHGNILTIKQPILYGPPKPPRSGACLMQERNMDKAEIRAALQNWQMSIIMNDHEEKRGYLGVLPRNARSIGDGKSIANGAPIDQQCCKKTSRRREPRRHTLQNGVDYNMLKKIKQIEQEKDVLMEGLQAVERAREWYLKQIANVQEKINYVGKCHVEHWSESQQERIELQRARIFEVNRHLSTLIDSSERGGLPFHMNLAVYTPPGPNLLAQLKQQNHLLTKDVNQKSEKINILEREKGSLLRELYQIRRRSKPPNENTAYI